MDKIGTPLKDVYIIKPRVHGDNRGWFIESFAKKSFEKLNLSFDFIQDNHSFSASKNTVRGLHFQMEPHAQTKLVRCTKGRILDVAVDLRDGSPTYKMHVAIELSAENKLQLLIPKGFAHGFLTLTDDVEVQYKVDNPYNKASDCSIIYNDPSFGIDWKVNNPILSEKDAQAPLFDLNKKYFEYEEEK